MANSNDEWDKATPVSDEEWESARPISGDTIRATPPRTWGGTLSEAAGNIVPSAGKFIGDVASAVAHPIATAQGIVNVLNGATAINPSPEESAAWDSVKGFYSQRYGSVEGAKKAIAEDPVGVLSDASTLLTAGGGALKGAASLAGKAGQARTAAALGSAGKMASKAGGLLDPMSIAVSPLSGARKMLGSETLGLPENLYKRAAKIPPGSVSQEGVNAIARTATREIPGGLPISSGTITDKIPAILRESGDAIDSILADATAAGGQVDVVNVLTRLDELKSNPKVRKSPYYKDYVADIDAMQQRLLSHPDVAGGGMIDLKTAHELKKGAYAELDSWYANKGKPESGRTPLTKDIDAASIDKWATSLRDAILADPNVPPAMAQALKKQSAVLAARPWIERAISRTGNINPLDMTSILVGMASGGGLASAAAYRFATFPGVMSRGAIWMAQGAPKIVGKTGRAISKAAAASRTATILSGGGNPFLSSPGGLLSPAQ